jgi:hypothetical protein
MATSATGIPNQIWAACVLMYASGVGTQPANLTPQLQAGLYVGNWTTLKAAVQKFLLTQMTATDVTAALALITSNETYLETQATAVETALSGCDAWMVNACQNGDAAAVYNAIAAA